MKVAHKLAVLLGLLPVAVLAASPEETYLEHVRKAPGVPVPVAVVAPEAPASSAGNSVEVEFTVEASGKVSNVHLKSGTDQDLADAAVYAVKEWKFIPAQRDGVPVAMKVILPVRVAPAAYGSSFAAE